MHVEVHGSGGDERREGEHHQRREQHLQRTRRDLLGRDCPHRHRREHAVFDLTCVAEVLHHGSATACTPWKIIVLAITPPTSNVENVAAPAAPPMA